MDRRSVWRSFAIGVTCGQRSMLGPAVVRWRLHDPLRLAFAALALGELIADKFPALPARTSPPALTFRIVSGAFSGYSVAMGLRRHRFAGATAGALGALVGAYGGMALRAGLGRATRLPDPVVAVFEDAGAIRTALRATRA